MFVQISALTNWPLLLELAKPPTMYWDACAISGWQRESKSGRGFPNMFFMPLVMNQAPITESARPSRPMCSSQSLRRHTSDFGVPRGTVAPGTKIRAMMAMITAGASELAMKAMAAGTVSSTV